MLIFSKNLFIGLTGKFITGEMKMKNFCKSKKSFTGTLYPVI